jgi:hypothetical protein
MAHTTDFSVGKPCGRPWISIPPYVLRGENSLCVCFARSKLCYQTIIIIMELLSTVSKLDLNKAKKLTSKRVTVNGESVNNIPSSFKGVIQLPQAGVDGDNYDFTKVVESTETYSRMTGDIEGEYTKNGKKEELKSKSAALWGGAINIIQKKASIVIDGQKVYAIMN